MSDQLPIGASFLWEPTGAREVMTPERFSDEQRAMASAADDFAANEIAPRLAEIESKEPGLMPDLLRKAGQLGLLMVDVPTEYGGLGEGLTTSMLIAEQFARVGSFSVSLGAHTGIGTMPIVYFGSDELKRAYLPDLATGARLAAYALSEPGSGSDALGARTKAVRDGDEWVLNGTKQFITNAAFADVFTVFAKVDGEQFTAFVVDRDTPGLTIGPEEHKLGIRGSSTAQVILSDVRIPLDRVLGEVGKGHRIAFNILNVGRIKLGVGTTGACKHALAVSARYALERHQFGRPIASFGLVSSKLADMAIAAFVGESMGYRTTGLLDEQLHVATTDPERVKAIEEFSVEASIIKVYGSEALSFCADEAVQIHGGYGYIEDYEPERMLRDSRIHRIFEGTNEINRLIVPGTILKRALTGRAPLLEQSMRIRGALASGDIPSVEGGALAAERQVAEFCKWICIYVLSVAAETYNVSVSDEQEILGEIADMISRTYALDSMLARVKQMHDDDHPRIDVARDMVTSYAPRAYGFVLHTGRHALMDMCDNGSLSGHLDALNHLRMDWPSKVMEAKRRIAHAVLEAKGFPSG